MKKEMLINVLQPEECRIAIVEDGVLEELYVERSSQESYVGNIYKGRIVNIEPSIQAAFVDFGIGRNGFLHVSDVDPAYYKHLLSKDALAEYEAEFDREYGDGSRGPKPDRGGDRGGRGRDRGEQGDRGGRGTGVREPAQPTSWLQPQPAPGPAPVDDEAIAGFAEGLDAPPPPVEDEEPIAPFAEGLDDAPAAVAPPPAPRRPPPPRPTPPPAPVPADDGDDFAAGLADDDDGFAEGIADAPPAPSGEVVVAPDTVEAMTAEAAEPAEPAGAEEPKKKPRARRTRKADEPKAEEAAGEEDEAKPKSRTRRTRKKADGEGEAAESGETPPDVPPKTMGGAERRTAAPDDEPEIQPFFDGADDFDPDAPNDRFADGASAEAPPEADEEDGFEPETAVAAEEEAREVEKAEREAPAAQPGRGFNDDFDDARPDRGGDRGGRDRDRGRG
ncbi:MAG TPA: hypothetical protein VH092_25595, partial [Urbifossiella sp.]|nr:hypothetical protein [Urbifossiella sp.]